MGTYQPHGIIFQKTVILILAIMRALNLISGWLFCEKKKKIQPKINRKNKYRVHFSIL